MAQWLGQFSGKTHKTAVLDAEGLMKHAVEVFQNASAAERLRKAKAVHALAKRLHAARVRSLRASIKAATRPLSDGARAASGREIERLQGALVKVTSGGIPAILSEFGAQGALHASE